MRICNIKRAIHFNTTLNLINSHLCKHKVVFLFNLDILHLDLSTL